MNLSDIRELYTHRQSCRAFDGTPVEQTLLKEICELALLAPSACNAQPWKLVAVTGEKVRQIAACTQSLGMNKHASNAGAFVVVIEGKSNLTAKLGGRMKGVDFTPGDVGIMTAHLILAADAAGVSSCILGWRDEKSIRRVLSLDDDARIPYVIALGYAKKDDPVRPKTRKLSSETLTLID